VIADAASDKAFLMLLGVMKQQGRHVSPNRSNAFAPTVFARMPEAAGIKSTQFEAAMERLLRSGKIYVEKVGPPSGRSQYCLFQSKVGTVLGRIGTLPSGLTERPIGR
jgi:hypothetical protein